MKKNIAALVFAILGAVFGIIGAFMAATCADTCAGFMEKSSTFYTIAFFVLGIGGAVLSLIGGIKAFSFNGGFGLSLFGLLMQIATFVLQCVLVEDFILMLSLWTLLSIVMLLLATVFAKRKQ